MRGEKKGGGGRTTTVGAQTKQKRKTAQEEEKKKGTKCSERHETVGDKGCSCTTGILLSSVIVKVSFCNKKHLKSPFTGGL